MQTTAAIPNQTDTLFAASILTAMNLGAWKEVPATGAFAAGDLLEAAKTPLDDEEEDEDDEDEEDDDEDEDLDEDDDLEDDVEDDDLEEDEEDDDDEDEDEDDLEDDDPKPLRVKTRL